MPGTNNINHKQIGGMAFAARNALLREFALGARVLILDPECEYRKMSQASHEKPKVPK